MTRTHRLSVYHQSHGHGDDFVSLDALGSTADVTHLFVAAVHLTDDHRVILNDHEHDDPHHDRLWDEVARVQQRGVQVCAMVGGWAPGTMCKLDLDQIDEFYPLLRAFLRAHRFDGIDIDVEQDHSLDGVVELVRRLRDDFGDDFTIVLAPVASALWGGANLSGFDYEELHRRCGDQIDFLQVQFYSGFGSTATVDDYERIVARGVWPVDKLVMGMSANPEDANGFEPLDATVATVTELCRRYPDFGGVDCWEYFRALPGGRQAPEQWVHLMREAMDRGRAGAATTPRHPLLGVFPAPVVAEPRDGHLHLPPRVATSGPRVFVDAAADLLGGIVRIDPAGEDAVLRLHDDRTFGEGAYRLDVTTNAIDIAAGGISGALNGLQTLRQLLPDECALPTAPAADGLEVSCCCVEDAPAHAWRGLMVDVARHFQPLPWLFRLVDVMAMHKLNVLHLHLTDDQGWRFEVKAFPSLVRVGSHRAHTHFHEWPEAFDDGTPHGGHYTQEQLRALVAHARRRGITVVPEVDLPGHVRALLAAHPEFGHGPRRDVAGTFGVFEEVLELTDETVAMVEQVLTELLDVFDSPWIHVGGDEVPREQWRGNPASAELARARGLDGVEALQRWFTLHLRDWLAERGRTMVAWDEVIDGGDVPGVVVMSWRGTEPGHRALAAGHQVVMAPGHSTYLDHYQSRSAHERYAWGGYTSWQKVARFDPAEGVPEDQRAGLLGIQGQLWSEYLVDPRQMEYQAFPRAAVLAWTGWRGRVDVDDFERRLERQVGRLEAAGVNVRPLSGPHPWQRGGSGLRRRCDQGRLDA